MAESARNTKKRDGRMDRKPNIGRARQGQLRKSVVDQGSTSNYRPPGYNLVEVTGRSQVRSL